MAHRGHEPSLALIPLDPSPGEDVAPAPDLRPEWDVHQTGLLGELARGGGEHVLAVLQAAAGREPERGAGVRVVTSEQQQPIVVVEQQHANGMAHAHDLADAVVVTAQGVGEPLGHGGVLALLPERDHDELGTPFRTAHVDDVAALQIADEDRSAGPGLDPAGGVRASDAGGDFGLLVERSADALAEALGGMIGHGYEHRNGERR